MNKTYKINIAECKDGDQIPVEDGDFEVKDNDENTPDDPKSVFTPGEKSPDYTITIEPKDDPDSDPLNPMIVTGPTGDNVEEAVVTIYPDDSSDPIIVTVCMIFII